MVLRRFLDKEAQKELKKTQLLVYTAIAQSPDSSDWVQKLNRLYVEIVAMEFGEDPATLSREVRVSSEAEDWISEYEKIRHLRPEMKIDKKTQTLIVTGLK